MCLFFLSHKGVVCQIFFVTLHREICQVFYNEKLLPFIVVYHSCCVDVFVRYVEENQLFTRG